MENGVWVGFRIPNWKVRLDGTTCHAGIAGTEEGTRLKLSILPFQNKDNSKMHLQWAVSL